MSAGRKRRTPSQERHVYGLTISQPSHPEVRRLQHEAPRPTLHGHKVWPTTFVLLDYLHQRGVTPQARVLEVGCGWGLVGIACATLFQAQVTGLDADTAVFPYLQLHAKRHGVQIATRHGSFADLTPQELAAFDLIVGADICFWEDLVDPLDQLIRHSVAAGVAEILVVDPSRPPFDELCARWVPQGNADPSRGHRPHPPGRRARRCGVSQSPQRWAVWPALRLPSPKPCRCSRYRLPGRPPPGADFTRPRPLARRWSAPVPERLSPP